jgi:hypothetical protein
MAKVTHQLLPSLRIIGLGLAVVALSTSPGSNDLLAEGVVPAAGYHQFDGVTEGGYPDLSCEPSFRGGNCDNCCLDLWRNYCAERTCSHAYSLRHGGLGYFGAGLCFGGACGGCTTRAVTCQCEAHSQITSARRTPSENGNYSTHSANVSSSGAAVDAQQSQSPLVPPQPWEVPSGANQVGPAEGDLAPPANTLPADTHPAVIEPSSLDSGKSNRELPSTAPVPPRINFFAEPPSSTRTKYKTVSVQNAGTFRLLQQLRAN